MLFLLPPKAPHLFLICFARWEKRSVLAVSAKHEAVGDTVGMMTAGSERTTDCDSMSEITQVVPCKAKLPNRFCIPDLLSCLPPVLLLPPRLSRSSSVSLESRYGTCPLPSVSLLMTCTSVEQQCAQHLQAAALRERVLQGATAR